MKSTLAVAACLLALFPQSSSATAQIPDLVQLDGVTHEAFTEPFTEFLKKPGERQKLTPFLQKAPCTASWRGHKALWKVKRGRLVLVKILANPCDTEPKEVPLSVFFGEGSKAAEATWFNGDLILPQGKPIHYVHMGYQSQYAKYLVLQFKDGREVKRSEVARLAQ